MAKKQTSSDQKTHSPKTCKILFPPHWQNGERCVELPAESVAGIGPYRLLSAGDNHAVWQHYHRPKGYKHVWLNTDVIPLAVMKAYALDYTSGISK